jgi:Uma2 family endonuclease
MTVAELEQDPPMTLTDLHRRFGPMPIWRIRRDPIPGTATVKDVLRILEREKRPCELVDGILVEKTIGFEESHLAIRLAILLGNFVEQHDLGIVAGEAGTIKLARGLVRIPDVAFYSWNSLPDKKLPRKPIPKLAPDLAVEVLSESNTRQEMDQKLDDYLAAGVKLVWYVDPRTETVQVFSGRKTGKTLRQGQSLDGNAVLPGFKLPLRKLFAEPKPKRTGNGG